jgi:hypothetical protein
MLESLTRQQLRSAPAASGLELDRIQGDVVIGLQKFFELFLFFEVRDVAAFKAALKKPVADFITSAEDGSGLFFHAVDCRAARRIVGLRQTQRSIFEWH